MAQLVEQRIRNAWVPGSSPGIGSLFLMCDRVVCDNSSVGRALASQARGHGFEPRLPLLIACFLRRDFNFNTKATLIRAAFSFLCCLFLKFVFI